MKDGRQMTYRRAAQRIQVGGSEVRPIPVVRTDRKGADQTAQRDDRERAIFVPGEGHRRAGKFPGLDELKQQWERQRLRA